LDKEAPKSVPRQPNRSPTKKDATLTVSSVGRRFIEFAIVENPGVGVGISIFNTTSYSFSGIT